MVHHILISSYSNSISTAVFDPGAGTLEVVSSVVVGHHPSWITPHPGDRTVFFTACEQAEGRVAVVKYDGEWKGVVVAEGPSGGADPCSLLVVGDKLYVANVRTPPFPSLLPSSLWNPPETPYSSGTISTIPISASPPYLPTTTPPDTIQLSGSSVNHERQESSHPHQIFFHHPHNEVLVPDLGADLVRRYEIAGDGSLVQIGAIAYAPGSGPRHVVAYDGDLYTLLELTSGLTRHRFPRAPAADPALLASVPSMSSPPPAPNAMLAAEILLPPPNAAFPAPYIYFSNRNDPTAGGDTISIFAIGGGGGGGGGGGLELVGEVKTGLEHVRGMMFGGEDDRWLVVGGANGGGVRVFERVEGGRGLRFVAGDESVVAPTGFLWV
ncbi:Lactonase, 7-bladed beta-propeller-domain-containing protein [Collybia nuda]|uniref:Lactonase, 7-bladed beta-propeller-domain-containing protein n=1 Tax=Collybia nuda TaxID=64659 RepID=A0A9P6CDJ2_9AGAR|nr:Lactonase, 7-bladed beta-propeller-domain-containing protein [Collybia nuda]